MSQQPPEKPARNLDEWDAEIEAEFRRVVRATKRASTPNASRRKGWLRKYTLVPREWEERLLNAKRVSCSTPRQNTHERDRAQSHARARARDSQQHVRDRAQGVPIIYSCSFN